MNKAMLQNMTNGELLRVMHRPMNAAESEMVKEEVFERFDKLVTVGQLHDITTNKHRAITER